MKKVDVKIKNAKVWVVKMKCVKCGGVEKFILANKMRVEKSIGYKWNGWYAKEDHELCPVCYLVELHDQCSTCIQRLECEEAEHTGNFSINTPIRKLECHLLRKQGKSL